MAEESENVGGINIEASVSDAKVDAGLAALLAKIESAAKQISGALVITPNIAQGANVQRQVQQSTQLTFGGRARGAATAAESTALERAIADALAKEGQNTATVAAGALKKGRESTNLTIEQALTQSVGGQAPTAIPVMLDTDQFMQQFAAFLTELKGMVGQASQVAQVDVGDGGGGGGKGGLRRKNIRDRGIGTEANAKRVYTYDPAVYDEEEARREAQASQARERILSQRRAPAISNAERRFLDTLEKSQQQTGRFSPEMQRELRELSYENQQQGGTGRTSATFASGGRSEAQIKAFIEAEQRRADQAPLSAADKAALSQRLERQNQALRSTAIAGATATAAAGGRGVGGGGRTRAGGLDDDDRERRAQQQLAVSEGQRITAARTARTFASGLGGFFLGQTRQQTEATIRLRQNEQALTAARKRLYDPEIIGSTRAYRQAQEEVAVAENKVAASLKEVQGFTGGVSAARTLAAVTVAGAAFGIGLKAVDLAISAVGSGLSNLVEIQTGFVGTSSRVTGELAKQTLALHGNVDAVLANAEAQAGLSASAADAIDSQVKLATQIKAGALAQQNASDLFRASQGVGGAQSGLFGGFGGLFGSSLFAQQLGGGRGLTELIQEDISSLQGRRGQNPLENINGGLAYLLNQDVRNTIDDLADQQGRPRPSAPFDFAIKNTPLIGQLSTVLGAIGGPSKVVGGGANAFNQKPSETVQAYLNDLTDAAKRGAPAVGNAANVTVEYAKSAEEVTRAARAAAAAGDAYGVSLAQQSHVIIKVNGEVADSAAEYKRALEQIAVGRTRVDPAVLAKQFDFERPALLAAAERQQQFALRTQQPAEQALQNLAQPLLPVGTGIAANADEQARLNGLQQKSQDLQDELNAGYAQGRQILATTYQVPLQLLTQIAGVGQQIAGLQAGISNEAAAYQTAQYNFQLQIARRTLADIGGLTGKNFGAGESYLGVLERQNLALSRQAQLLQFALAQRQINFQQAVAGFQAPGVTPEERQANVKEAQIEADYAQKQLDIQRQMFGNQVQIVDIQNLRQGADLAAQIGLLLQGRQLTLDTAAAQEQIALLQTKQSQLVAQAGTYLTKINSLTGVAFSQIQQLEAAAGKAMAETAVSVLESFGLILTGLTNRLQQFNGISDSRSEGNSSIVNHATGYVGTTAGKTMTGVGYMGEAGSEAYAILRNPRALMGNLGGGGDVTIIFGDTYVRDDGDIGKIVTRVMQAIGTRASLAGLRLNG